MRIPERRTAILDRHAGAATRGQPHGALGSGGLALTGKHLRWLAGGMEDAKNFVQRTPGSLMGRPARHPGRRRIHEDDATRQIRRNDTIREALKSLEKAMLPPLAVPLLQMPLGSDLHRETQFIVAERLQEVALRMRLACSGHRFEVGAGRDIQNGHRRSGLESASCFDAVDLTRQMHIQQYQIGPKLLKTLQRLLARGTNARDNVSQLPE